MGIQLGLPWQKSIAVVWFAGAVAEKLLRKQE
jgi:hypothetical protein